ncbi:hypothetical protein GCM10010300_64700 [Streptomyces olivaceoviridis]|nr:hypothetical protein GCM10010300_64700 [Streptomyces olivaceoviridis]
MLTMMVPVAPLLLGAPRVWLGYPHRGSIGAAVLLCRVLPTPLGAAAACGVRRCRSGTSYGPGRDGVRGAPNRSSGGCPAQAPRLAVTSTA